MKVIGLTAKDPEIWSQVNDQQIFVSDMIDAATNPDAKMTVGFARQAAGETLSITFPYDEVLVLIKGTFTVRTEQGETITARAGDLIYLPAGSTNVHHADEDTEIVYVANPPDVYAQWVAQS